MYLDQYPMDPTVAHSSVVIHLLFQKDVAEQLQQLDLLMDSMLENEEQEAEVLHSGYTEKIQALLHLDK